MTTRKAKPRIAWGVICHDGHLLDWAEGCRQVLINRWRVTKEQTIRVRIVPESDYKRLRKIEREHIKLYQKHYVSTGTIDLTGGITIRK